MSVTREAAPGVLLVRVAGLLRQAQVYDLANALFATSLPAVLELVRFLGADGELTLDFVADSFFVNRGLVRLDASNFESAEILKRLFTRFNVQRLRFAPGATEVDLRAFLAQVQKFGHEGAPSDLLKGPAGPVHFATMNYALGAGGGVAGIDSRQNVLRMYARLAVLLENVVTEAHAGKPFRSPLLRKTVQGLAQASDGHDALLAGLTRFANFTGKPHFHLAAVTALTLLMGKRLALSRTTLIDLGVNAALHELPAPAGEPPLPPFQSLLISVRDGFTVDARLQATTAMESQIPLHVGTWTPGPLGRLISVPCAFDRLTSGRDGRVLAPDQALRALHAESGTRFDPAVIKLFTATVGVFPIGSMVRLTNGDTAVVLEVPRNAQHFARPIVKVVRNAAGRCDVVVDLSLDPEGPAVAESIEELKAELNPTAFLLA